MANLILYIDTSKAPTLNPVLSQTNNTPDSSELNFVSGDKFPVTVFFVNGGILDTSLATTGSTSSSYYLAIGDATSNTPLTSTNRFYISHSYGVTCSLDLSTAGITGSFGTTNDYVTKTMQLSVYSPSGSTTRRTYMLRSVNIYDAVDF